MLVPPSPPSLLETERSFMFPSAEEWEGLTALAKSFGWINFLRLTALAGVAAVCGLTLYSIIPQVLSNIFK